MGLMVALGAPAAAQDRPPPRDAALAAAAAVVPPREEVAFVAADGLLRWFRLREGDGALDDYAAWFRDFDHWPLPVTIQREAEQMLEDAAPEEVRAFFADRAPRSADGWMGLFDAHLALGDRDAARAIAERLWRGSALSAAHETALLTEFGDTLAPLHTERLDMLLWEGVRAGAGRMLDRVPDGHARLGRARLALQARESGVNALIDRIPAGLASDPGLAHDRFQWRMDAGLRDSAAELLLERSASAEALGRPEAWARWRIFLARTALSDGEHALAYDLASTHHLDDGVQFADLEWLAGFIALRHLDRPDDALRHFRALRIRVSSPISLGRAGYWEALAQEALGNAPAAEAALMFAAEHQTGFYGLLAADRAGLPLDPALANGPDFPDWRQTALAGSDLLEAALLLIEADEWHEARRMVIHLARTLTRKDEFGALADLLLDKGEPNMALNVAKIAVQHGFVLPRAYFPLNGLENADLPADPALVLAIARRESEFDPAVVSPADARGLMQVVPGTGRMMARELGIEDFTPASLTTDAELNARLGAAYLDRLTREFGPSLALVAAGYNAGPGRPRQWIDRLGDPRDPSVDIVDWVESVPFAETRNYIMRVAESLIVYRARLAGGTAPIEMEALLRGG